MNATERRHCQRVGALLCLLCRRFGGTRSKSELHHVAEGSGLRSNFAVAPLCHEHHQGKAGLHGMGSKAFLRLYRPPGDSEYGLLAWVNEDLALADLAAGKGA